MFARFLSFVEIRTKITSLFAFLLGMAWLTYQKQPVLWTRTGIFFAAMFLFDLTTTAVNNYVDTRTNAQKLQFSRPAALAVILVLFAASAGLGLVLARMTDLVVLLVGGACFLCGLLYTWGPLPISRLPLGEVFSGIFYGLLIPFLLVYINMPAGTYLTLHLTAQLLSVQFRLWPLAELLLLAVAPACATAAIMLANNICDLKEDIAVKRHTLPYYLGVPRALKLFAWLSCGAYPAAFALVLLRVLPPVYLALLISLLPVQRNIRLFFARQEKGSTFLCSIKNYVLVMAADVLAVFLCSLA